nr:immunoglobulin heavy chain junction region [Homo sapiens]
SLRVEDTAVY